jgi:hypothetical protein
MVQADLYQNGGIGMNEYEALARALLSSPQGAKAIGNLNQITEALNKPEGKKLLGMLAGGGGDALKTAAESALKGDSESAKNLISGLLSTREGAELARQIIEMIKG